MFLNLCLCLLFFKMAPTFNFVVKLIGESRNFDSLLGVDLIIFHKKVFNTI